MSLTSRIFSRLGTKLNINDVKKDYESILDELNKLQEWRDIAAIKGPQIIELLAEERDKRKDLLVNTTDEEQNIILRAEIKYIGNFVDFLGSVDEIYKSKQNRADELNELIKKSLQNP